jgi:hypothetical protein
MLPGTELNDNVERRSGDPTISTGLISPIISMSPQGISATDDEADVV